MSSLVFSFLNSRPSSEIDDELGSIKSKASRSSQEFAYAPVLGAMNKSTVDGAQASDDIGSIAHSLIRERTSFTAILDSIQKFPHSMLQIIVPNVHVAAHILFPLYFSHYATYEPKQVKVMDTNTNKEITRNVPWEIPVQYYRINLTRAKILSKTQIVARMAAPANEITFLQDFLRTPAPVLEDVTLTLDNQYVFYIFVLFSEKWSPFTYAIVETQRFKTKQNSPRITKFEINVDTQNAKPPILSQPVHDMLSPILVPLLGDYPAELFVKQQVSSLKFIVTSSVVANPPSSLNNINNINTVQVGSMPLLHTQIELQSKFKSALFVNIPFSTNGPAHKVEVSGFSLHFQSDFETKKLKLLYISVPTARIHGNQAKPFINMYLTKTSTEVVLARPLRIISSPEEACKDMEQLGVPASLRTFVDAYSCSKSHNSVAAIEEYSQFRLFHKYPEMFGQSSSPSTFSSSGLSASAPKSNVMMAIMGESFNQESPLSSVQSSSQQQQQQQQQIVPSLTIEAEVVYDKQYYLMVDRKPYFLEKGTITAAGQVTITCASEQGSKVIIDMKDYTLDKSYNVPATFVHKGNIFKCMEPFKWIPGGVFVADPFAFRMPFAEAEKQVYLRLNVGSMIGKANALTAAAAAQNQLPRASMIIPAKNITVMHKPTQTNIYEATLTLAKPYPMRNFVPYLINLTAVKGKVKATVNNLARSVSLSYDGLEMEMELFTSSNSSLTLKNSEQDRYFFVEHQCKLSFFCKMLNLSIAVKGLKNNKQMKKLLVNFDDWTVFQTCIYVYDAVNGIRMVAKGSTMNKDEDEFELDYSRKYVHLVVRQKGGLKSGIIGLVPLKCLAAELAKAEAKCKKHLVSHRKQKVYTDVTIQYC